MGSSNFFALLDDIANVLDDVATLTKVATQKTSGVLGDDLALNANQVSGATPDRELPIVWAVAKGSAKNKAILVPLALLISALLPVLITPFLVVGGLYLCFEGCEKVIHTLFPLREIKQHYREHLEHLQLSDSDLVTIERDKIKGAVRTDFILSAEIIVISLGTVSASPLLTQIGVLIGISFVMTIGVYGLVAAIVKVDDFGLYLNTPRPPSNRALFAILGRFLVFSMPYFMKMLSIVGTLAMFMVGGGIITHGSHFLHLTVQSWSAESTILATFLESSVGFISGLILVAIYFGYKKLFKIKGSKG